MEQWRAIFDRLSSEGIVIAWAKEMAKRVLWMPAQGVVVLNASCPRAVLAFDVMVLVWPQEYSPLPLPPSV